MNRADVALPEVHIFSKHLQFLDYIDMADAAAQMGFAGVDLTVRPDGHIKPERATTDLPKAVAAIKKAGLRAILMTTVVGDANDPVSVQVLNTAAQQGIRLYRTKWYQYNPAQSIPDELIRYQAQLRALGELNQSLGLTGCYQNHSGTLVGATVWEIWEMLKTTNPAHMGVQYDIRHAMVEGGESWPNGLRLLLPAIKALTIKDFIWTQKNGKWVVQDVPLGEGMVDFKHYFRSLKNSGLQVPITLHIEYPAGGAEHGATRLTIPQNELFTAIKRDLNRLRTLWQEA